MRSDPPGSLQKTTHLDESAVNEQTVYTGVSEDEGNEGCRVIQE